MRIGWLASAVLVAGLCRTAGATAQTPEEVHVNGRVLTMQTTPLASLVEGRIDLTDVFPVRSTGCWRGYVGTWSIEGDRLLLLALEYQDYVDGEERRMPIPLSSVFGEVAAPVHATWYTGTLRIPLTARRRYVHMGFGTIHDRELRVGVRRGVLVSKDVVDARSEGLGRSVMDLQWCALPSVGDRVPVDDGAWTDARALAKSGAVADGTVVRTRGLLDRDGSRPWTLWIPETLVTPDVFLAVQGARRFAFDRTWPHVELEAAWRAADGGALAVRWIRPLEPGETIHHPAFPLPPLPNGEPAAARDATEPEIPPDVRSVPAVARVFGGTDVVTLHGPLGVAANGTALVLGVDVADDPLLRGKPVRATGVLEKWVVTDRLLAVGPPEVAPFRARGPGTYHRLVDAEGRLARPVPGDTPR